MAARVVFYAKSAAIKPLLARPGFAHIDVTCACFGLEAAAIRDVVRASGARTLEELGEHTPASRGCGTCRPEVQRILDDALRDGTS